MIENLQDLLTLDTDKNKADDNKKLLRKVKQLLKAEKKESVNLDEKAEKLPYRAVSVIGTQHITLKFDLESREAVVDSVEEDSRKELHMASFHARGILGDIIKEQQ